MLDAQDLNQFDGSINTDTNNVSGGNAGSGNNNNSGGGGGGGGGRNFKNNRNFGGNNQVSDIFLLLLSNFGTRNVRLYQLDSFLNDIFRSIIKHIKKKLLKNRYANSL